MKLFGRKNIVNAGINKSIKELNKLPKDQLLEIESSLEEQLSKLSKKQRKKAEKLLNMYEKGQFLRPDKDIDNKKIILDGE